MKVHFFVTQQRETLSVRKSAHTERKPTYMKKSLDAEEDMAHKHGNGK